MGNSSGQENANLYVRGVNEARRGELLAPTALMEILDVFGEDGVRSYLLGWLEGLADVEEGLEDLEDE